MHGLASNGAPCWGLQAGSSTAAVLWLQQLARAARRCFHASHGSMHSSTRKLERLLGKPGRHWPCQVEHVHPQLGQPGCGVQAKGRQGPCELHPPSTVGLHPQLRQLSHKDASHSACVWGELRASGVFHRCIEHALSLSRACMPMTDVRQAVHCDRIHLPRLWALAQFRDGEMQTAASSGGEWQTWLALMWSTNIREGPKDFALIKLAGSGPTS